jgi:hypothetical protein
MSKEILRRLDALEAKLNPPLPQEFKIFSGSETDADVAAFCAEHPHIKVIHLVTICGRRCPGTAAACMDYRKIKGCRFDAKGTQEYRSIHE